MAEILSSMGEIAKKGETKFRESCHENTHNRDVNNLK